ncbi:spore germination protein GerPB [Mesobacillus subterraneus]|uniref:Spore gernimation protein n=1 Tax=Mesobacillus subterraneus TaxID=285983 RepID=A0A3R9FLR8_9BACI|nr:spore germination protein GerPB [Mesobacillus subterraneus]RSD29331.1 spore gernimation protein [Mesobacillus subterraneus]
MNFYIQQSIHINMLRIDGITNSSVLQIGSAGLIKPVSYLYNTGGFTEPAPEAVHPSQIMTGVQETTTSTLEAPAVPLQGPVRLHGEENK